ncbi:MAG: cbb3-type cytochrome c oxidase subunit 3 [Rhizobiales bacterium]|jgi:cytochrome c oxidase cbb3-type subunit 4|nr:cbb3-type cytochrome c oxidase subunit 3 [Hyphomicrobiales bacterium]MBN9010647.1 cbb3-type cytochrome c oxidase subunit 3 [Hyphomicrobiales bacterium]
MTDIGHDALTFFAKSWGLLYLALFAVGVLVYTFWPGNRKRFHRAKNSIMKDEDGPWA